MFTKLMEHSCIFTSVINPSAKFMKVAPANGEKMANYRRLTFLGRRRRRQSVVENGE